MWLLPFTLVPLLFQNASDRLEGKQSPFSSEDTCHVEEVGRHLVTGDFPSTVPWDLQPSTVAGSLFYAATFISNGHFDKLE